MTGHDAQGENTASIVGAKVVFRQMDEAVVRETTSGPGGYYELTDLPPGDYQFSVIADGYLNSGAGRTLTVRASEGEHVLHLVLTKGSAAIDGQPSEDLAQAATVPSGDSPTVGDAQQPNVHGRVFGQDPDGQPLGPVREATIEFFDRDNVLSASARTDANGYYCCRSIPPGDYSYRLVAESFLEQNEGRGVQLRVDSGRTFWI